MSEDVILVDLDDRPVGKAEKIEAHAKNLRHRAISVLVFDREGRMLLQQRSAAKYHSAGLWSNACCGHPRWGDATADAAARRLFEEMGFTCPLIPVGRIAYQTPVGDRLYENEVVHVFIGQHDGAVMPDKAEVSNFDWCRVGAIRTDMVRRAERYTAWFRLYAHASWFNPPATT